ncbi:hypothetical protein [Nocardia cyriacigeorgica]|uniref:hypothetical protein n=1 Tax=Nocardia cyriacigeorgica TaxID=135487 RepID=UPI000CE9E6D0|nr:hypothetical protein [Nocardia cyriacigeorgica]AVH23522.1 hypothetical protein C5B73_20910 [Nocardia cyriacigeorgica]MBF6323105.1 hypothetical protein [Nocardia cyriacigeorgica]PPJ15552.1 hypothetical protein C5E43_05075 [Nocardia cyriacigeorgica]
MERGSSKHGPKRDDELAHELQGTLKGNRSSRAEEWRDPEPPADDDPDLEVRPELSDSADE